MSPDSICVQDGNEKVAKTLAKQLVQLRGHSVPFSLPLAQCGGHDEPGSPTIAV